MFWLEGYNLLHTSVDQFVSVLLLPGWTILRSISAAAFAVYLRFRSKENPWQGYPAISVSHWRSRVNIWADFKERSVGSKRGTAVAEGYDVDEGKVFLFNQANGQERHEGQKEKSLLWKRDRAYRKIISRSAMSWPIREAVCNGFG